MPDHSIAEQYVAGGEWDFPKAPRQGVIYKCPDTGKTFYDEEIIGIRTRRRAKTTKMHLVGV